MYNITIYHDVDIFSIVPGARKRDWMDQNVHAYRCTPLAIANEFGWDIIVPFDIEVEWNGGTNAKDLTVITPVTDKVKSHFGSGTITFNPGFRFETLSDIYLSVMPVPNQFSTEFISLSAIIETDKLKYPWFLTIRMLHSGYTKIEAGTKLARILPINVKSSIPAKLDVKTDIPESFSIPEKEFADKRKESKAQGIKWTQDYVKSVDYSKIKMPI